MENDWRVWASSSIVVNGLSKRREAFINFWYEVDGGLIVERKAVVIERVIRRMRNIVQDTVDESGTQAIGTIGDILPNDSDDLHTVVVADKRNGVLSLDEDKGGKGEKESKGRRQDRSHWLSRGSAWGHRCRFKVRL